jgi:hypothetical protein
VPGEGNSGGKGKAKLGGDEGGVEGLKPGTDGKGNNGGDDLDGGG